MRYQDLLAAVHPLVWPDVRTLACGEPGHPAGHTCLVGSDPADLPALREELGSRYGEPSALVEDGRTVGRAGSPLLAPDGDRLADMGVWPFGGRWIGCGTLLTGEGPRPLVRIAERPAPPLDALPGTASAVERLAAITDVPPSPEHPVDWPAVEARLGTRLPGDYKRTVEVFGPGSFDGWLQLYSPLDPTSDLVEHTEWLRRWSTANGTRLWEPYGLHPSPGGLLQWAATEQADAFYWITDGPDPDRWPVVAAADDNVFTDPFPGSTASYVCALLTDPAFPLGMAGTFSAHWFQR
ncbi:MAG: hypothetical protein HOY69_15365 [Streptomyces sp.]|nr:hypothetical protein [Streptomyces sp.]